MRAWWVLLWIMLLQLQQQHVNATTASPSLTYFLQPLAPLFSRINKKVWRKKKTSQLSTQMISTSRIPVLLQPLDLFIGHPDNLPARLIPRNEDSVVAESDEHTVYLLPPLEESHRRHMSVQKPLHIAVEYFSPYEVNHNHFLASIQRYLEGIPNEELTLSRPLNLLMVYPIASSGKYESNAFTLKKINALLQEAWDSLHGNHTVAYRYVDSPKCLQDYVQVSAISVNKFKDDRNVLRDYLANTVLKTSLFMSSPSEPIYVEKRKNILPFKRILPTAIRKYRTEKTYYNAAKLNNLRDLTFHVMSDIENELIHLRLNQSNRDVGRSISSVISDVIRLTFSKHKYKILAIKQSCREEKFSAGTLLSLQQDIERRLYSILEPIFHDTMDQMTRTSLHNFTNKMHIKFHPPTPNQFENDILEYGRSECDQFNDQVFRVANDFWLSLKRITAVIMANLLHAKQSHNHDDATPLHGRNQYDYFSGYLTCTQFRQDIECIVDTFLDEAHVSGHFEPHVPRKIWPQLLKLAEENESYRYFTTSLRQYYKYSRRCLPVNRSDIILPSLSDLLSSKESMFQFVVRNIAPKFDALLDHNMSSTALLRWRNLTSSFLTKLNSVLAAEIL